ncbi:uncharacterized protein LOC143462049 isoform X2 [Clavelina lepadiformis]|uniref:uncharacterized protein LOC143462049 isoform X2 n=1 Tax=Clavelina lepadiformis TaxID=159417 RepID=UPI0040436A14
MMDHSRGIYLEIVEQPKQRGMRFRYECEGRSAGSIPGENTTGDKKTWPSCQIVNYRGLAVMRVSLVNKDDPPKPHPHSLVGRDCSNGVCQVNIDPGNGMLGVFPNLGIQCVRRKEVSAAIRERLQHGINPYGTAIDGDEKAAVDVDLNIVRLCFEAFLPDRDGNYTHKIGPVTSNPIFDKKATSSSVLKICRVDKTHGSVQGNDEIFLLCDKVQKDIQVVFCHKGWEAYGEFSSADVHRQVAIVFRTPPYRDDTIQQSVEVEFMLRRPSDSQTSAPVAFTYLPRQHDIQSASRHFSQSLTRVIAGESDPRKNFIRKRIESRARTAVRRHPGSFSSVSHNIHPARFNSSRSPARIMKRPMSNKDPPPIWDIPVDSKQSIFSTTSSNPGLSSSPFNNLLGRDFKQEKMYNSQASDQWPNQSIPFPSSQPAHPDIPPTQKYIDMFNQDVVDFSINNTENLTRNAVLPVIEATPSFNEVLNLDSFPSIGPEATSQVLNGDLTSTTTQQLLENPDLAESRVDPKHISLSNLFPSELDELTECMQHHCSIDNETALQPSSSQQQPFLNLPNENNLMSISEDRSMLTTTNNMQQHLSSIMSPPQPIGMPLPHPMPGNTSVAQNANPNSDFFQDTQQMLSPSQPSPHPVLSPPATGMAAGYHFQSPTAPYNHNYRMVNTNNNHQHTGDEDVIDTFLRGLNGPEGSRNG